MEVRSELRPSVNPPGIEILASKSGLPVPVVNGKSLHSRYDPEAEAKKWVAEKMSRKPGARVAIVLGMGFGYHISALKDAMPAGSSIVVFEACSEMVTAYARSVRKNIDNVRLWPSPTPQDVTDAVAEVLTPTLINHTLIVGHPPSLESLPAAYQNIHNTILSAIDQIRMSMTTGWGFGFEWIENSFVNARRLPELSFVSQFMPLISDPAPAAAILGAGPSMDECWETISRSKVLKFAADTTLEPMEQRGMVPHLAFLFDSQLHAARLVERIDASRINLVTSLDVHPSVFEKNWRNLAVANCDTGILSWLERRGKFSAGTVKQGGSVVTCAFDLARQAGCSPMYFGGVDLSFRANQIYCRGTAYERRAAESLNRYGSVENEMYLMRSERTERMEQGRATQDNLYNYYRWLKDEIGRTKQEVLLLKPVGLLSEFVPDGGEKILTEKWPAGYNPNRLNDKLPANGILTADILRDAMKELRRQIDDFLKPAAFEHPDKLESSMAGSDISDILSTVVEPAVAAARYDREKGIGDGSALLTELRDRLGRLAKKIPAK